MNPAEFVNIAEAEQEFWWYRGMRRILYGLLDPLVRDRSIETVLEAGCGTGYNAAALQQRYGWRAYALDLEIAGLRYGKASGMRRLIQADVSALPFGSESLDAVISLDVIVHFPRNGERPALSEFSRVLAPGGLLVLRVAALDVLRSRHSQFAHERQRFTAKRLIAAVAQHGIRPLRCTYANTLLFPIALAKFRVWEPLTQRAPQSGVRPVSGWLNRLLTAPLAAEDRLLRTGLDLPLGQSVIFIGEKHA
jgi:SAM-dependent methyltransferase